VHLAQSAAVEGQKQTKSVFALFPAESRKRLFDVAARLITERRSAHSVVLGPSRCVAGTNGSGDKGGQSLSS
jgi:hypothetical protein